MLCLVEIEANKINTLFWTWCLPNFHIFFILSVTLLVVSFSLGKKKKNNKKWGGGGWGWGKIMWSLESRKTKLVLCLGVNWSKQHEYSWTWSLSNFHIYFILSGMLFVVSFFLEKIILINQIWGRGEDQAAYWLRLPSPAKVRTLH